MLETINKTYTIKKEKIYASWHGHFSHLFFFFQDFTPISDGIMRYGIYNLNVAGFIMCLQTWNQLFLRVYSMISYRIVPVKHILFSLETELMFKVSGVHVSYLLNCIASSGKWYLYLMQG